MFGCFNSPRTQTCGDCRKSYQKTEMVGSGVARSQTTPGHCIWSGGEGGEGGGGGGGGLGACFPSKFLHLRGSYSDCS